MRYDQTLEIRQSTQLTLTSQLKQAIALLQLSSAELNTFIAEQMLENPLLSTDNEFELPTSSDSDNENTDFETQSNNFEDYDPSKTWTSLQSFDEHLESLIRIHFKGSSQTIAFWLKECLNEDGILVADWQSIVLQKYRNKFDVLQKDETRICEQIQQILARLQAFEPAGIFARSVVDCLRLQLISKFHLNETAWSKQQIELMCAAFDHLKTESFEAICKRYSLDHDVFKLFLLDLKQLNFSPATLFDKHERVQSIIADVIVTIDSNHSPTVQLNTRSLPKVLVNSQYYKQLTQRICNPEELTYFKEKLNSAQWLVNAIAKRSATLLQVSIAIANWQKDFLINGTEMRAMTLKDIAQEAGVHESTVSRITTAKYIESKRGVFELKALFVNPIKTSDRESASSIEIQNAIRSLINDESKDSPLSDEDLVALLGCKGFNIARRTIAKYRTLMNIGSSSQRKKHYKMNQVVNRAILASAQKIG